MEDSETMSDLREVALGQRLMSSRSRPFATVEEPRLDHAEMPRGDRARDATLALSSWALPRRANAWYGTLGIYYYGPAHLGSRAVKSSRSSGIRMNDRHGEEHPMPTFTRLPIEEVLDWTALPSCAFARSGGHCGNN